MAAKPKAENIPDEHHVVRHCKNRLLKRRRDRRVYGVQPGLFHLRPPAAERDQEKYLSASYYEFFAGNAASKLRACCKAIPFSPKKSDGMVRLNVGKVKEQGSKRSIKLRVTHEGKKASPSYSAIRGVPFKPDHQLCALLAYLAVVEIVEVGTL
jgi:hypothetical protein